MGIWPRVIDQAKAKANQLVASESDPINPSPALAPLAELLHIAVPVAQPGSQFSSASILLGTSA
jgi:hypothetical protein